MSNSEPNPIIEIFQAFFFLIAVLFGVTPMEDSSTPTEKDEWDCEETYYLKDGGKIHTDELIDF